MKLKDRAGEDREETKKFCRVCGRRVLRLYKRSGGKRCSACLHRTHGDHLAGNLRVCQRCSAEELFIPGEYYRCPRSVVIVHLSDLHVGRSSPDRRTELLKNWLGILGADYVLVSGDLTGRAGGEEYQRAAQWIRDIEAGGMRVAAVPGNHDIGYWGNVMSIGRQAAGRKYHRWIKIIDRPIEPCVRGPGCVIVGLNSAHGISHAGLVNGYLNGFQRARAVEILKATPPGHLKAVFCHHPLVRFDNNSHRAMFRAEGVRRELEAAGAELFLWGHQHSFAAVRLGGDRTNHFAVQSPTLSGRTRDGGLPGFTVIDWLFGSVVVIRAFIILDDLRIVEEKRVEFPLQGGTAPPSVE
ncbi:MAG: metallophosphoesterase family protein [Desulfocucumaceae bacterium]